MNDLFAALAAAVEAEERVALGIISSVKGSSPQKRGAKALFFADGRIVGTLGGGCLEAEVRERARQALLTGKPAVFDLVLDHDFGWDDGLICGGKVSGVILPSAATEPELWRTIARREEAVKWGVTSDFKIRRAAANEHEPEQWLYRETVSPPCALWLAGSGHVAKALAPVAQQLDFAVTVFDDRAALANHERFPTETMLKVANWSDLLREPLPRVPTFGVIVTRGHQHDAMVLREWIRQPFAFIGMIGSQRKRRVIFEEFLATGIATEQQLAHVECPVGVNIQAVTVPEIAISVAARLVQRRAELRSV